MKHHCQGFTTIEMLGTLAIGGMMLAGLAAIVESSLEDAKGQQAAYYQSQVVAAATKYIKLNYGTLAVAANVNTTTAISLNDLVTAKLLPPSFGTVNAYGQVPCLLVRTRSNAAGATPAYLLDALVVTEGTAAQAIPEVTLFTAAGASGNGGGAISAQTPTAAIGAYGSWKIDGGTTPSLANFLSARCSANTAGAGSLATAIFYDGPGQLSTDYLYRNAIAGHSELNQMNTPLRLGTATVVNENDACGSIAAIAVDSDGNLMNCNISSGRWKYVTTWKRPVASYNALPGVTTPATDQVGDVRMTLDTGRAFMYAGGSIWSALAVDQNGDLVATRNLIAVRDVDVGGNVNVDGNVNVHNDLNAEGNVNAHNDLNALHNVNSAGDVNTAGNVNATSDITSAGSMYAAKNLGAGGNANLTGDVYVGTSIYSGVDIYANRDVHAGRYVTGTNVSAP